MKLAFLALIIVLLFGPETAGLAQAQTPITLDAEATQPIHRDGDFWRFRVRGKETTQRTNSIYGGYEILYRNNEFELFSFSAESRQREKLNVFYEPAQLDLKPSLAELVGLMDVKRVWRYLEFPLFVGKRWKTEYRAFTIVANNARFRIAAETWVSGIEQVSTNAGNFQAFRIQRESLESGSGGIGAGMGVGITRHVNYTYFYSPETRSIVKYQRRGGGARVNIELRRFGSANDLQGRFP